MMCSAGTVKPMQKRSTTAVANSPCIGAYIAFGHVSRNIVGDQWMNSNRICYIKRDLLVCVEEEKL